MAETLAIDLGEVRVERGDRLILRDVNWQVARGESWAVLGPNGAGKSTLIRVVTGYLWPTTGTVSVLGARLGEVNLHELRRRIGLINPSGVYEVERRRTAREVVLTGFFGTLGLFDEPTAAERTHAEELLEELGLGQIAHERYGVLSSGEQMRVLLARALARRPELLVLDEPTAGLDIRGRESVLATVERLARGKDAPTVVMVTHRPEELPPVVAHVLLLAEGTVAACGPASQVLRDRTLSRAYGCPVQVARRDGRWSLHVHPSAWSSLLGRARDK